MGVNAHMMGTCQRGSAPHRGSSDSSVVSALMPGAEAASPSSASGARAPAAGRAKFQQDRSHYAYTS